MAVLNLPVSTAGLSVPVFVGLSQPAMIALQAAGRPIPPPVQARGLLDTGSNVTAVAAWIVQQLQIPLAITTFTHTAAGRMPVNVFEISLSITDPLLAGSPWLTSPHLRAMELMAALPDTDVIVGLDVLLDVRLILDGPSRQFSLEF